MSILSTRQMETWNPSFRTPIMTQIWNRSRKVMDTFSSFSPLKPISINFPFLCHIFYILCIFYNKLCLDLSQLFQPIYITAIEQIISCWPTQMKISKKAL